MTLYAKPGPELISRELESIVKELPPKVKPEVERLVNSTVKSAERCNMRDVFFSMGEAIDLADKKKISPRVRDTLMRLTESILDQSCGCRVK